jgi:hypothetical protein
MTKRSVLSLAIKILGICLVVMALPTIPLARTTDILLSNPSLNPDLLLALTHLWFAPLISIFIGVLLICFGHFLALMLIPDLDDEPWTVVSGLTNEDILILVLLGLGVWLTVQGIVTFACSVLSFRPGETLDLEWIRMSRWTQRARQFPPSYWAAVGISIVQFAIGLLLVFRARRIALWLLHFQQPDEFEQERARADEDSAR